MQRGASQALTTFGSLKSNPAVSLWKSLYQWGRFWGTNQLFLREALSQMMPTLPRSDRSMPDLVQDAAKLTSKTVLAYLHALDRWNVVDRLERVRMPTQVLWGAMDALVPRESIEETAHALPRGKLTVWSHVGHSPQLECPGEFVDFLLDFVSRRSIISFLYWWFWRARRKAVQLRGRLR